MGLQKNLRMVIPLTEQARLVFVDGSSQYLPGVDAERRAMSQLFARSTLIDAVRTDLAELQFRSKNAEIWHYTGHGRRDGSGTSLDLNGSQSLRATDFTPEVFSGSQLVVLAACSSGRSGDRGQVD